MPKRLEAYIVEGNQIDKRRVTLENGVFRDGTDHYVKLGSLKTLRRRILPPKTVALLSRESASSFDGPRNRGDVELGDDPTNPLTVTITPGLFHAVSAEEAARDLGQARKLPPILIIGLIGLGVGLGWLLNMLYQLALTKIQSGG